MAGANSSGSVAVLFVHGVETRDPDYAQAAIKRLTKHVARHCEHFDESALVIEPAYWLGAVEDHQDLLMRQAFHTNADILFRLFNKLVVRVNSGIVRGVVPLALSGLFRQIPGVTRLNWPTMRWAITYFVGDAIAYQASLNDSRVYDAVHLQLAIALRRLAERAGPDAPLCVIGHSLGTVIASDHIWDLQQGRRPPVDPQAGSEAEPYSPLELGQTLALFYTLGSPIGLWTLRLPDFGTPITVPAPELERRYRGLPSEWLNFVSTDDVVAYPLRGLSPLYEKTVTDDREVKVGPPLFGQSPAAHVCYWHDDSVMEPIGRTIAHAIDHLRG